MASAIPPEQLAKLMTIVDGWKTMQITNYLQMSGHALIVADYLHTLPDEIRLMWPSEMSLPKILFFTLRYYVFFHHILAIVYMELKWAPPEACHRWFMAVSVSAGLIVLLSEVILFVRVYAFSGRTKIMKIFLIVQYTLMHAPAFTLLVLFAKEVVFTKLPIPICMPVETHHKLIGGCFTVTFASVLIVMLIMAYIAYHKHRDINSTLLSIFYRDGVYYFVCLSGLAAMNSIINFAAPQAYKFMFIQLEIDLHVILATRMLLHLREWSQREQAAVMIVDGIGYSHMGDTYNQYHLSDMSSSSKGGLPPMEFPRREIDDGWRTRIQTSTVTTGNGTTTITTIRGSDAYGPY